MGNVGYAFEFNNKGSRGSLVWNAAANAPTISIDGRKPGRSGWNVGVGARFQKKYLSFDVKYDYCRRSDLTSHRVGAKVSRSPSSNKCMIQPSA